MKIKNKINRERDKTGNKRRNMDGKRQGVEIKNRERAGGGGKYRKKGRERKRKLQELKEGGKK
jgi:hypothetical protein